MVLTFFIAIGYLLGSIPFGLLVGKYWFGIDPRKEGSGNIGTTNVMRVGGRLPGILTFVLDLGKGTFAVWIAQVRLATEDESILMIQSSLVGVSVICGHVFPIFLKFKGGKGVATLFGVLVILHFPIGLVTALIWIGTFLAKRISSLSALMALAFMPFLFLLVPWILGEPIVLTQFFIFIGISILLTYRHKENIIRLLSGEEGKLKAAQKSN